MNSPLESFFILLAPIRLKKNLPLFYSALAVAVFLSTQCFDAFAASPNAVTKTRSSWISRIENPEQFLEWSTSDAKGVKNFGRHMLFVIRRDNHQVMFAHPRDFDLHFKFAKSMGLAINNTKQFFLENYNTDKRKLILGIIVHDSLDKQYYLEFGAADKISKLIYEETYAHIKKSFFAPISIRPSDLYQAESLASITSFPTAPIREIRNTEAVVHQSGSSLGYLRLLDDQTSMDAAPDTIALLKTAPIGIAPVRGIIVETPSSPLSHLRILARTWKIPDLTIPDAVNKFSKWNGKLVRLTADRGAKFSLALATTAEEKTFNEQKKSTTKAAFGSPNSIRLRSNLSAKNIRDLSIIERKDADIFGAKCAQLAFAAKVKDSNVPRAICIPFYWYNQHISKAPVKTALESFLNQSPSMQKDTLKEELEALKEKIRDEPLDEALILQIENANRLQWMYQGVFVRSSTNAEDLPMFNGAGLYSSVPNVKSPAAIYEAIKTVWSSVWNLEAYLARQSAGIDHRLVQAGTLIQIGVNADASGVMITCNPFKAQNHYSVYINAKRGLGMRVVNGFKVPEELIYNPRVDGVTVIAKSNDDVEIKFNPQGGVSEQKIDPAERFVLTDDLAKRLAIIGNAIEKKFGGQTLDIEWVVAGKKISIVQARPYIE